MPQELEVGQYLRTYYGDWYRVVLKVAHPIGQFAPVAYAYNVEEGAPEDGVYQSTLYQDGFVIRNSSVEVFEEFEYLLLKATEHAKA